MKKIKTIIAAVSAAAVLALSAMPASAIYLGDYDMDSKEYHEYLDKFYGTVYNEDYICSFINSITPNSQTLIRHVYQYEKYKGKEVIYDESGTIHTDCMFERGFSDEELGSWEITIDEKPFF